MKGKKMLWGALLCCFATIAFIVCLGITPVEAKEYKHFDDTGAACHYYKYLHCADMEYGLEAIRLKGNEYFFGYKGMDEADDLPQDLIDKFTSFCEVVFDGKNKIKFAYAYEEKGVRDNRFRGQEYIPFRYCANDYWWDIYKLKYTAERES